MSLPIPARAWAAALSTLVVTMVSSTALAQDYAAEYLSGRIEMDVPELPPPSVELDFGQGLIRHAIEMGDAAAAGFLQGLTDSADPSTADNMKYIAQQLTSAREFSDAAGEVIQEVHVRAWEQMDSDGNPAEVALEHFDDRLRADGWSPTIKARETNKQACVFVLHEDDSVRGVFLIASEGEKLALVNVIGNLSTENIHRLTETLTRIGVQLGLDKKLNRAVGEIKENQARRGR